MFSRLFLSLVILSSVFTMSQVSAQNFERYIVKVRKGVSAKKAFAKRAIRSTFEKARAIRGTNGRMAILKVRKGQGARALRAFNQDRSFQYIQKDHFVKPRLNIKKTNDIHFDKLWGIKNKQTGFDANILPAWSKVFPALAKRKVAANHAPVIAIVDGGVDYKHEDLKANMWVNNAEIPGNGIDDDKNGHIDDIHGWNFERKDGRIVPEMHGTHVAGISGARGGNKKGVVGVHPYAKIMSVTYGGKGGLTSQVVRSYSYILEMKKRWLSSGGKYGANIVAVNSSFGVDGADCMNGEYPVWNDLFNQLGKVGILSVVATANRNWDIDKVGDVPSGCSSPYVVAVTNMNSSGDKNYGAGYGTKTIDLAAPGTDIFSTTPRGNYESLTGTSMATPHVTGAVGFLHLASFVSPKFRSVKNPSERALVVKKAMLTSVTPNKNFRGRTVSGGNLNIANALNFILK